MNIAKVEENVQKLLKGFSKETFIYDLLLAYGQPKSAVTRLKQGIYNISKEADEVLWKKKLFFKLLTKGDLHDGIDEAIKNQNIRRQDPRFIIVTDYKTLLAFDTRIQSSLDIDLNKLAKYFDFFLPWAGLEKVTAQLENPADIKAAEKMAKLYDQIKVDNPNLDNRGIHSLNVFLSRLLFCYFAEDTGIFEKSSFTTSVASHTLPDGSDLNTYLDKLFEVLNSKERQKYPKYLQNFPYVNGGLLSKKINAPTFSTKSRKMLIDCGELDWSEINPDIFGSMIQAVVHPSQRGGMGMHYTSVPNIMKVIRPLFLDELYEEFQKSRGSYSKLDKLLIRIYKINIFDPACGSGNFLIIAYKEIRKLEILIFQEKSKLKSQRSFEYSSITLGQFFGIEVDDFATEVALLSLWLAEHQMNLMFKDTFGDVQAALPLRAGGNIVCDNSNLVDWYDLCGGKKNEEVYVLGNPPYLGARNQTDVHKSELKRIFKGDEAHKDADYVSCWFLKGAEYIAKVNGSLAFVATNSVVQGEQVGIIWPRIFSKNIEINFAHQSFKWTNNAKDKAGVTCVIVGLKRKSTAKKILIDGTNSRQVSNISPYLIEGGEIIVHATKSPINGLPKAVMGNMPRDGGHLILSTEERNELLEEYPQALPLMRKYLGAQEFLDGTERWCLWITDEQKTLAESIPPILKRIEQVFAFRSASSAKTTRGYAAIPHKFAQRSPNRGNSIIIPAHTSERRLYIPFGFFDESIIVSNSAHAIFDADLWIFGLISSKMHQTWVRAVAGKLETRLRYSAELCYNTFPVPELKEADKSNISNNVLNVLQLREKYSEQSLGDLYDPDKIPEDLLNAHLLLDEVIDKCYRSKAFTTDEQRLEYLFQIYVKQNNQKKHEKESHA